MSKRVLLLGATGVFGSRLAAMLADMPGLELVLAARGLEALTDLKRALEVRGARARLSVQTFDRRRPEDLATLRPWLLIDAAGPFQDSDYGLALATVRAGAHYIDLSDGRAFVAGFHEAVHAAALQAGVLAVTGASSTPALSHAALGELVQGWRRLDRVAVVISPGGQTPRGLSVVQAILSYVGRPIGVFRGGGWRRAPGWSGLRQVYMPGLGARWASICETPDLDLLPQRFKIREEALFLAGLDPPVMHFGLVLLSLLVRARLVRSLRPFARLLRVLAGVLTPLGSDRGGMIVEAEGLDMDAAPIRARWALWAEANAGPNTPAAPAAALVRKLLEEREPRVGGFDCAGFLSLGEIVRELETLPIHYQTDQGHPESSTLLRPPPLTPGHKPALCLCGVIQALSSSQVTKSPEEFHVASRRRRREPRPDPAGVQAPAHEGAGCIG
ncbi:MAG TPA: saccharopine dehydrogenase [Caulobacteraceae bacterium]